MTRRLRRDTPYAVRRLGVDSDLLQSTRASTAEKRPRESPGEEVPASRPKIAERRTKKTVSEAAPPVAGILTSATEMTADDPEKYSETGDGSLFGGSSIEMIKRVHAAIKSINAIATSTSSKLNKADTSSIAACSQDILVVVAVLQIKLMESETRVAHTRSEINSILAEAPTVTVTYAAGCWYTGASLHVVRSALHRTQIPALTLLTKAYRTTSTAALPVLARVLPADLDVILAGRVD
ncbi:hypothetical protein EVAR_103853_1 [Eumeta japonica]|uniref:Uncharacterized protein n=1 Tax=Eumeta variegata TaxID=151549 RepID=A0A4C2AB68_EUMVA|nr:hypothetical protein EVAR_103853_1 [Eumeta japonica]